MIRLFTPTVVFALALLSGLYAIGAWLNLALRLYVRIFHRDLKLDLRPGALPVALVAVVFTALTLWLWNVRRRMRRTKAGHCPNCDYDLRATPGRCPVCGWTPAGDQT